MKLYITLFISLFCINTFGQTDTVKTYFENGQVESVILYLNGVREGEAKFYDQDGNNKEERNYMNDKVDGLVKLYYSNGNLKELYNIENGKREGPVSMFDSSGNYIEDIIFENGVRIGQEFLLIGEYREEDYQKYLAEWKKRQQQKTSKEDELSLPPQKEEKINYEEDPAYYLNVEVMPEPIGGMNSFYKRLSYSREAREKKIEGVVQIRAFIENSGEVSSAEVVESVHPLLDESARLAVYYTRFKPGLQRGKPIKVQMIIPVEFKLEDK
ncbi:MAG: TonB family protein [Ignavibacteriaceae bacterium]|nr:TonB family protein [Ignavibacteriaceae bacterium]